MERQVKILLVVSLFVCFGFFPCFANDPVRKLARGAANLGCGWLEIGAEIFREAERTDESIGTLLVSPFKGLIKGIGRTLAGVYEIVSFPIPIPRGYQPLVEPEFIF